MANGVTAIAPVVPVHSVCDVIGYSDVMSPRIGLTLQHVDDPLGGAGHTER